MLFVVAVLAAWSCSSRDELQSEQERVPIRLATSLDGTGARTTRAGTTNNVTQSTEFLAGQYVDAYIKVKGGDWVTDLSATTPRHFQVSTTDTNSDGIVDGDLDRTSGEAMDYYPMDATPVTIYAVHPSVASDAAFTVSNNQTDADNYAASDLCYSKTADYNRTESKQTLRFKHVLSKIVVNVDVSELGTPAVSNLRLKAKTQTSITYPYPSDATNDYLIGSASEVDYIKMNVGGAAIIPPQKTSAVGDVLITFDVAGVGPISYKFPANTTFASNTQYIYTVKVGGTISVTSTITDWDAGTYSPGDELVMTKNIKMNPLWYVATGNMTSANEMGTGMSGTLYTWNNAMDYFSTSSASKTNYYHGNISISGQDGTWHLPVHGEWWCIIPLEGTYTNGDNLWTLDGYRIVPGKTIKFGYNDETKDGISESSYWKQVTTTELHAIRFLGTYYCSAWRYRVLGSGTSSSPYYLEISATLIELVEDNSSAASAWYSANFGSLTFADKLAVQRTFYACGYNSGSHLYTSGYYRMATENGTDDSKAFCACFGNNSTWTSTASARVDEATTAKTFTFSVRLFRDN